MKKIMQFILMTLLCLIFGIEKSKAGVNDTLKATTYADLFDTIIKPLHKPATSTGFLYERMVGIAKNYLNFQGNNFMDTTSSGHFKQSLLEWDQTKDNRNLSFYDTFIKYFDFNSNKQFKKLSITGINYDYLDSNSLRDHRINFRKDGRLYDSFPRSDSAFKIAKFITACLPYDSLPSGQNIVVFGSKFIYGNVLIDSIKIEYGGNTKIFKMGDTFSITLNTSIVYFKYTLYSGNNIFNSIQKIKIFVNRGLKIYAIEKVEGYDIPNDPGQIKNDGFDSQTEIAWFTDGNFTGTNNKTFGNTYNKTTSTEEFVDYIRKPVLFLDGYDAGDERHIPDILDQFLSPDQGIQIGDQLINRQYDLGIINFKGLSGAGDMARNGEAVYKFIKEKILPQFSKTNRANPINDLVIIAPSMAGQIIRYVMLKFEGNNINHHVANVIYFDSPHKGASVSPSVQAILQASSEYNYGAREKFNLKLKALAAEQLLDPYLISNCKKENTLAGSWGRHLLSLLGLYQYTQTNYNYEYNIDPARKTFVDKLASLNSGKDYPINCRNVSLVDGSINNTKQGYNLSDALFQVNGNTAAYVRADLAYGSPGKRRIADGEFSIFGGVWNNGGNAVLFENHYFKSFLNGPTQDLGCIENAPGSYVNEAGGLYDEIHTAVRRAIGISSISLQNGGNCAFIPTVSALAYNYKTQYLNYPIGFNQDFSNRNLLCEGTVPFDRYYATNNNTEHVTPNDFKLNVGLTEVCYATFAHLKGQIKANEYFNFAAELAMTQNSNSASTEGLIDENLDVLSGGKLFINNKNYRAGYNINGGLPKSSVISTVNFIGICDSKKHNLIIESGAELHIGDDGEEAYRGVFNINDYAIITIKSGGKLFINHLSKLNVNNNAKLILEDNAIIYNSGQINVNDGGVLELANNITFQLNGSDSRLSINNGGQMYLSYNSTFTPTYSSSSSTHGIIEFTNSKWITTSTGNYEPVTNLIGSNATFSLSGLGKSDVWLNIGGGEGFRINNVTLNLSNLGINMICPNGEQPRLNTGSPISLNNVKLDDPSTSPTLTHRGLNIYGQQSVSVTNCEFDHGREGIYAALFYLGNQFGNGSTFNNNIFNGNVNGLVVVGSGFNSVGNLFTANNSYGLKTKEISLTSYLRETHFNTTANNTINQSSTNIVADFRGFTEGKLKVRNSSFANGSFDGLIIDAASADIRCSFFALSPYNIHQKNSSFIRLSSIDANNKLLNEGRNHFFAGAQVIDNTTVPATYSKGTEIFLDKNYFDNLYIENGYNYFNQYSSNYDFIGQTNTYTSIPNPVGTGYVSLGYYGAYTSVLDPVTLTYYNKYHTLYLTNNKYYLFHSYTNIPFYGFYPENCDVENISNCPANYDQKGPSYDPTNSIHESKFDGANNPTLNNQFFQSVPLSYAVNNILEYDYTDNINFQQALTYGWQVLTYNYGNALNQADSNRLGLGYSTYLSLLSQGISSGQINGYDASYPNNENLSTQLTQAKEVLDYWITHNSGVNGNYPLVMKATLDKAGIYALSGQYDKASSVISNFLSVAHTSDYAYLNLRKCTFDKIHGLKTGTYSIDKVDSVLSVCDNTQQQGGDILLPTQNLVNNQSIDRNGKLLSPVNLFPNPATDVVNIAFDFPVQNNVQIEVVNSNGMKVDARQYPNPNGLINIKYPLQNLSSGIYLFNIIYDGQNITKRLNVIK